MFLILTVIFGLIVGSFLNAIIWRLHTGESIIHGRSCCPKCGHKLSWYDNIPLVSFLLLKARCRYCHEKISWQYPLVELATALLFVLAYQNIVHCSLFIDQCSMNNILVPLTFSKLLRDFFIISILIIIFVYDLRWYLIEDKVVLPAIGIIFFWNVLLGESWFKLLISGIIISGFFLLQFLVSRGHWIGAGDIRLGMLVAVILGWPLSLVALFLSYIIGSVVSIGLVLAGQKKFKSKVPFGPFLVTGTLIAMFWGEEIVGWYTRLL